MHPKVVGSIHEIDAVSVKEDASYEDALLADPSLACIRLEGSWKDDQGVVHAVNSTWHAIETDVDLGRETACGSASWDPDNPRGYPVATDAIVDCMTCIVRQARSCL